MPVLTLVALVLGVGNAAGRSFETRTVTVEVIGKGTVTSDPGGVTCGNGSMSCYLTFSGDQVTLTASESANGWQFQGWRDIDTTPGAPRGCDGANSRVCTITGGDDHVIVANFSAASMTLSTLSVTYSPTTDAGLVTAPAVTAGNNLECGNTGSTAADAKTKCTLTVVTGSTLTVFESPEPGKVFSGWGGACSGTASFCTVQLSGDAQVNAAWGSSGSGSVTLGVAVNGSGNVSGGSGAINCGNGAVICTATFAVNATVTLVATAATGATFLGWTGACGGTATTCTVSMSQSRSVTATFSAAATTGFVLTVSVTGNGTVTGGGITCGSGAPTCTTSNNATGSSVTLTAAPAAGATFSGWGGGTCFGTTPTCTVVFNAAKTVTATFTGGTSIVQLSVSVSGAGRVSGGSISCGNGASACSASVDVGTSVTLTATPAAGAKFTGWGGSCTGTAASCTVSMTAAKSVSATFTAAGTPGTLTITVGGKGGVSTTAGTCTATGPSKTCVQGFKAGASATLTAKPAAGQSFLGWSGACSGTKATCTVKLTTAQSVTASFSARAMRVAALAAIGAPVVAETATGFRVTLRFTTTLGGVAHVRGLRAGRAVVSLALRVAAGRATIGPFPVELEGLYTFEIRLAGRVLRERACLGACGRAHTGDPFALAREAPAVTRTGDVWSVMLRARASQISDARIRAYRGARLLVNQHFLGRATRIILGPFLLGPGSYTLRLTATDPYGRTRTLVWIVSLGR